MSENLGAYRYIFSQSSSVGSQSELVVTCGMGPGQEGFPAGIGGA
jgi:hypothetical protein